MTDPRTGIEPPSNLIEPRDWLVLLVVATAVAVGAVWAVFGSVTVRKSGVGMMMDPRGLRTVVARDKAIVESHLVDRGERVEEGAPLVELELVRLERRISDLKSEFDAKGKKKRQYRKKYAPELDDAREVDGSFSNTHRARLEEIRRKRRRLLERIERLEEQRERQETLEAPISGRVFERYYAEGEEVRKGETLVTIVPEDWDRKVLVGFVPRSEGRPAESQRALILPNSMDAGEFGYIEGTVQDVSRTPRPRSDIAEFLKNPKLVDSVFGRGEGYRVEIELIEDDTPTGLSWTIGRGPESRSFVGTLCSIEVESRELAPIEIAFPSLRR